MRQNLFDGIIKGAREIITKRTVIKRTLGAALTITTAMPNRMILDPAGARTITLPAEAAGLWYEITNTADAAENITIVEDAGVTTIAVIGPGQTVELVSDGVTWYAKGAGESANGGIVNVTTSVLTLTRAAHGNNLITLNRAAGIVVTLPAAIGSGVAFDFFVGTAFTATAGTISVANSNDTMAGHAIVAQDAADTALMFDGGGTDDSVNMNGGTRGGALGDTIHLRDAAANLWMAECFLTGTGTEATPFSAMVS